MHQLLDYDLSFEGVRVYCDNTSAINLSNYIVHHSRAKHIDIKHHFIRDHVESGDFLLEFVDSENQLADIFTKPLLEKDSVIYVKVWVSLLFPLNYVMYFYLHY